MRRPRRSIFINPASAHIADSDAEAERLASSARMAMKMLRRGRLIPVPPVGQALRFLEHEGRGPGRGGRRMVLGAPETVRERLEEVAAAYGAAELIVVTITHDPEARRRSYELIAGAFELTSARPAPPTAIA